MATINTGMQRATELTVNKKIGGVTDSGYPRVYRLYEAFGNYTGVSVGELSEISIEKYKARLEAFKTYVESIEMGVSVDTSFAYRENHLSCPI